MTLLKRLLDRLPFNGLKTALGVLAAALVLGLQQLGYLDPALAAKLLDFAMLWAGVGLLHKGLKAAE